MNEKQLQNEIQQKVREKLSPIFNSYRLDFTDLEAILKWKPIVLILGNFSSGKSTMINEICDQEIQRTGQAPTDDSFTILSSVEAGEEPREIPGATLVNDDRLPFSSFKVYGEKLISHFHMKKLASPRLENLAIIDSPGMLDSVAERDRGYDFLSVVGDFAKLADLVVLMFDPHKAGTVRETYNAIRTTLPETAGEDRVVFVMNRIDECDNLSDLVRSYGTLCWNLSQMTGRKDIPRIFLTFAPTVEHKAKNFEIWTNERRELIEKIIAAPELRISHILQSVDKQVNELRMVAEAMMSFSQGVWGILRKSGTNAGMAAVFAFFFLDVIFRELFGFPQQTFLAAVSSGSMSGQHLFFPLLGVAISFLAMGFWFSKWQLPRYIKESQEKADSLVNLGNLYKEHTWARVKKHVVKLLSTPSFNELFFGHQINMRKIDNFIHQELQAYYAKIR